jgi:alkylation response protein AidB-like acyl-CoA dehydrogenase
LSREQKALQQAVREVLEKEATTVARETEETEAGYSRDLWQKMADLGWMGVGFPEEYGGTEGDFVDLVVVLEEMGKVIVPGPYITSTVCSGRAILDYGNETQKKAFLPGITAGKLVVAPALTRPDRWPEGKRPEERLEAAGSDYLVSGARIFVPYASTADWYIWSAGANDSLLLLINARSAGIECSLLPTIAGDKQCLVVMDHVRVPAANVLGEIGKGSEITGRMYEWGALAQSGFIAGLTDRVLRMAVGYAKKRVQFDRLIGSFQAIQHQCADMATDVDEVRFLTYQAAWRMSKQLPATREVSMAKARGSDAARRVCLLGTKIHGGIGIILDYDMQLYFRKAKPAELAFGDGDFHREIIARQMGI